MSTAKHLFNEGIRSKEEFFERLDWNHFREIGLKYVRDFEIPIPSNEIREIEVGYSFDNMRSSRVSIIRLIIHFVRFFLLCHFFAKQRII